jgi:hypothetical protein
MNSVDKIIGLQLIISLAFVAVLFWLVNIKKQI